METSFKWLIEDVECVKTMGQILYFESFQVDKKTPNLVFDAARAQRFDTEDAGVTFMDANFPKGWRDTYAIREHGFG